MTKITLNYLQDSYERSYINCIDVIGSQFLNPKTKEIVKETLHNCPAENLVGAIYQIGMTIFDSLSKKQSHYLTYSLRPMIEQSFVELAKLMNEKSPPYKVDKKVIGRWKRKFLYEEKQLPYQSIFHFSKDDLKTAFPEDQSSAPLSLLPICYDYAFYMVNETNAFETIFRKNGKIWEDCSFADFYQWGYKPVAMPQRGDLVVYCCNTLDSITLTHMGIWMDEDKVLSKHGQLSVALHPLNYVDIVYGNSYYFLHKKTKSYIVTTLVSLLAEDFTHTTTRSPWSSIGVLTALRREVIEMPIKKTFSRSLYNISFNEQARADLLLCLESLLSTQYKRIALGTLIEEKRSAVLSYIKDYIIRLDFILPLADLFPMS